MVRRPCSRAVAVRLAVAVLVVALLLALALALLALVGGRSGSDDDDFILYRVTDIADGKVVLDGNHPLAGTALVFTCTVTAVRPASATELEHGHVHDDGECDDE